MLGVDALGVLPLGVLKDEDVNATFEPYAAVFDNPDLDLVYLVEIESRPPDPGA